MNALTDYKHFAYSAAGVQHETRVCRCSDQRNIPNRVEITITETYKHFATATAHVDVLFFVFLSEFSVSGNVCALLQAVYLLVWTER